MRIDNDATLEDPEAFPEPAADLDMNGMAPNLEEYLVHSHKYVDTTPEVIEVADRPPQ